MRKSYSIKSNDKDQMNRIAYVHQNVIHIVRTSCYNVNIDTTYVEKTLLSFIRRQGDDFNGFPNVRFGRQILDSMFPQMPEITKKELSRALWVPIVTFEQLEQRQKEVQRRD